VKSQDLKRVYFIEIPSVERLFPTGKVVGGFFLSLGKILAFLKVAIFLCREKTFCLHWYVLRHLV
jgi:hypothetical protein